jgi:hypothetical protein
MILPFLTAGKGFSIVEGMGSEIPINMLPEVSVTPGESCARLVFESDFLIFVSAALQVSFYSSLEYSEKYTLTNN